MAFWDKEDWEKTQTERDIDVERMAQEGRQWVGRELEAAKAGRGLSPEAQKTWLSMTPEQQREAAQISEPGIQTPLSPTTFKVAVPSMKPPWPALREPAVFPSTEEKEFKQPDVTKMTGPTTEAQRRWNEWQSQVAIQEENKKLIETWTPKIRRPTAVDQVNILKQHAVDEQFRKMRERALGHGKKVALTYTEQGLPQYTVVKPEKGIPLYGPPYGKFARRDIYLHGTTEEEAPRLLRKGQAERPAAAPAEEPQLNMFAGEVLIDTQFAKTGRGPGDYGQRLNKAAEELGFALAKKQPETLAELTEMAKALPSYREDIKAGLNEKAREILKAKYPEAHTRIIEELRRREEGIIEAQKIEEMGGRIQQFNIAARAGVARDLDPEKYGGMSDAEIEKDLRKPENKELLSKVQISIQGRYTVDPTQKGGIGKAGLTEDDLALSSIEPQEFSESVRNTSFDGGQTTFDENIKAQTARYDAALQHFIQTGDYSKVTVEKEALEILVNRGNQRAKTIDRIIDSGSLPERWDAGLMDSLGASRKVGERLLQIETGIDIKDENVNLFLTGIKKAETGDEVSRMKAGISEDSLAREIAADFDGKKKGNLVDSFKEVLNRHVKNNDIIIYGNERAADFTNSVWERVQGLTNEEWDAAVDRDKEIRRELIAPAIEQVMRQGPARIETISKDLSTLYSGWSDFWVNDSQFNYENDLGEAGNEIPTSKEIAFMAIKHFFPGRGTELLARAWAEGRLDDEGLRENIEIENIFNTIESIATSTQVAYSQAQKAASEKRWSVVENSTAAKKLKAGTDLMKNLDDAEKQREYIKSEVPWVDNDDPSTVTLKIGDNTYVYANPLLKAAALSIGKNEKLLEAFNLMLGRDLQSGIIGMGGVLSGQAESPRTRAIIMAVVNNNFASLAPPIPTEGALYNGDIPAILNTSLLKEMKTLQERRKGGKQSYDDLVSTIAVPEGEVGKYIQENGAALAFWQEAVKNQAEGNLADAQTYAQFAFVNVLEGIRNDERMKQDFSLRDAAGVNFQFKKENPGMIDKVSSLPGQKLPENLNTETLDKATKQFGNALRKSIDDGDFSQQEAVELRMYYDNLLGKLRTGEQMDNEKQRKLFAHSIGNDPVWKFEFNKATEAARILDEKIATPYYKWEDIADKWRRDRDGAVAILSNIAYIPQLYTKAISGFEIAVGKPGVMTAVDRIIKRKIKESKVLDVLLSGVTYSAVGTEYGAKQAGVFGLEMLKGINRATFNELENIRKESIEEAKTREGK